MGYFMLNSRTIVALQDKFVDFWHKDSGSTGTEAGVYQLILDQHASNFKLWHLEDKARLTGVDDAFIAQIKRQIDQTNQRRNNLIEAMDEWLLQELAPRDLPRKEAALHSETPGMIIDRLSILSLKIYHTQEEINRAGAPAGHAERNQNRYEILIHQRGDLANCLASLWQDILAGKRQFKLYRQLKMYNDPTLNPALYDKGSTS
jgi:hypothetical protein